MPTTTSSDGTRIAYDRTGSGPAVVVVPGVFNDRSRVATLAGRLADDLTVLTYDRRARGGSTDEASDHDRAAVLKREVADLDAVIAAAGGRAAVVGYSSGALLALHAAAVGGAPIDRLALYEPPFTLPGAAPDVPADLPEQVAALVAEGRPGDAVALYQTRGIGLPAEMVDGMRREPFWASLEAMAPSVVYDAVLAQPGTITAEHLRAVGVPTLVASGAETWEELTRAADAVAEAVPGARRRVLDGGAAHDLDATAFAPAVVEFLAS